jgi:hypothetical protein
MFIRVVDQALERLLRVRVPLPVEAGDISFAVPSANWASRLSRPTVSLFLYEVVPSGRPGQAMARRVDADGRMQRRLPSPVLELNYLISAWAANPLDEHQLLGEVINQIVAHPVLPVDVLPGEAASPVQMIFNGDDKNQIREVWRAAGGQLKASCMLSVIAAADAFPWTDAAPPVSEVLRGITRSS